jgi:hypothetical protein
MLTRIAAYPNAIEAHLARLRLEAEGIPAFVLDEHLVWADWRLAPMLGGVKLCVHRQDAETAIRLLRAHDHGEFALPEESAPTCPRCAGRHVARARLSWRMAMLTTFLVDVPLWFHWATRRCRDCRHEWDPPDTRAYPLATLGLAGVGAAVAVLAVFWGAGEVATWGAVSVFARWVGG